MQKTLGQDLCNFRGTVARKREPNPWWLFMGRQTGPVSGLLAEAGGLFQSQQPEAAHLAGFSGNFSNSLFCPEVPSCWGLERPSLNQALASLCLSVSCWWQRGGAAPAHPISLVCACTQRWLLLPGPRDRLRLCVAGCPLPLPEEEVAKAVLLLLPAHSCPHWQQQP